MSVVEDMERLHDEIDRLVTGRRAARAAGDYELADAIRREIEQIEVGTMVKYGVVVSDQPNGSDWHWTVRR